MDCFDNIPTITENYEQVQIEKAIAELVKQGQTEADAKNQIDKVKIKEDKEKFAKLGSDVKKNKPDERYIKVISYIEDTYECSGMCTPSLFYLT